MSIDYNIYLSDHISNVKRAFQWCLENIPEIFKDVPISQISPLVESHDDSKWGEEEYQAYDNYFYGSKTKEVKEEFDFAWLHHQHHNPHHWQHWLLQEDDGKLKALPMPKEYCLEMIFDWWSFSWRSGNLTEIFNWYATNKKKMILHESTLEIVEKVLTLIRNKLQELTYE